MRRIYPFVALLITCTTVCMAEDDCRFNSQRWDSILSDVRVRATEKNISEETINATLRNPAFIKINPNLNCHWMII